MRGNIKSFEKPFTHAEVVALAERTLKRFGGVRSKAGRYARSMENRYESSKWAQVVEVLATSGRDHATKKSSAQLDREVAEVLAGGGSGKGASQRTRQVKASTAPARTSGASFSVMLQLPDDPTFSIPGMTLPPMYSPVKTGLQWAEAVVLAKRTQEETGRHVRVYVEGRNYDTAEFGPRPVGYKPRSLTAKLLPGVPMAR